MSSVRKSLALSFAEKYSALVINGISLIVLARLLTPAEIGIYSVGAAVVAVAHVLRDFGVGNYLIQEQKLTQERVRTAFGVALVIAWVMAAVVFALSGSAAHFYAEPGLRQVLRVLSLTFLIIPFSSQVLALLQRDMAFGPLYVIGIASTLVHAMTGITLAALGFGFMSLTWASLAGVGTTTLIAAFYRPSVARLLPSFKEWRRVATFGSISSAASIVAEIGMTAPDLILGRLLGFTAVGFFSRAAGLVQLFNRMVMQAVLPVMTPAFAAKNRRGEDLLGVYLKGLSYVTVLAWPFFIFLGFMAYPIIRILFGDQWDDAVPIVQILCLAGIFRPLWYFVSSVFIALGEVRINLKVAALSYPLFVILFLFGTLHSLEAAAFSSPIFCFIYFVVSYRYLRDLIGLSLKHVAESISKSLVVAVFSAFPVGAVYFGTDIGPTDMWRSPLISLFGSTIVWICCVFVFKHPFREEIVLYFQVLRRILMSKQINAG